MLQFALTCDAVAGVNKKTEKVRLVAEYLIVRPVDDAARAAIFLCGRAFPAWEERTLQVGGALLWRAVAALSGKTDVALRAAYRKHGDLGSAAADLIETRSANGALSLREVADAFDELARTSAAAQKAQLLHSLLQRATPLEAKYIIKIISRDLRIGLRESLVEEAIAKAFGASLADVQRANMMLGDIGETLRLAQSGRLNHARMRLFHPLGFMLASPVVDANEAFSYFTDAIVEDKYDGIRVQAHCGGKDDPTVRLFSRTLDEISASFPELPPALRKFPEPLVLDGEVLAWSEIGEQALPFSTLQRRLGRKQVSEDLIRDIPVVFVAFDVLYAAGDIVIDRPLEERKKMLEQAFSSVPKDEFRVTPAMASGNPQGKLDFNLVDPVHADPAVDPATVPGDGLSRVILAPLHTAGTPEHLEKIFAEARERGNEGLMMKDRRSLYTPGRRGKSWLKLKRELATLDVVVTAVEWGHGKRVHVLSDYTFAVRDGDRLLNVGKAYSGLTDAEIAEMTQWFLEHTLEDQGFRRLVEPSIVLEVAFNNVMRSDRHESGFALRFPRILRIRTDKPADDIDTVAAVGEIFERQSRTGPDTALHRGTLTRNGRESFNAEDGCYTRSMTIPAMSAERFWSIIEEARKGSSGSADPKVLVEVLNPLSDRETSAFGHMFYEKLCELNFWKLWAAGYVISGGMGDDQFHYFRSWIIGKGKNVFDAAMRDPDQIGPYIDNRNVDNELLEYVAVEIMEKRGGEDPRDLSDCDPDAMPRGQPFEEETVRKLCPTLASLFE